jgi:hypothetical protein
MMKKALLTLQRKAHTSNNPNLLMIALCLGILATLTPVAAENQNGGRLRAWTTPAPTDPQTDATIKRFAAMNHEEIDAYVSDLSRQFIAARKASIEAVGGQQDLPFWTQDSQTGHSSPTLPLVLMRNVADLTLLPPQINTNPMPEYNDK